MEKPKNSNYAATIVEIKNVVELDNCDNVQHAIIMGNSVIVSKDVKPGDVGAYFPVETQLSKEFLSTNNLYRKSQMNADPDKTGYFDENGRVRCVKFRGNKSEGFFIKLEAFDPFLEYSAKEELSIGCEFDMLGDVEICRKYIPKNTRTPGAPGSRNQGKKRNPADLFVDNQFRFHQDTAMLYKNLHRIKPDSLISITYKLHGTSGISAKILHKRELNVIQKIAKFFGIPVVEEVYKDVCSSRKVIKTVEVNPRAQSFYSFDIWNFAHDFLKEFLHNGMTIYYEVVGYLPSGAMIQKNYDYGYSVPKVDWSQPNEETISGLINYKIGENVGIYIYRITQTSTDGRVVEYSAHQVQQWCKLYGLNAVPQLFYGFAAGLSDERMTEENWQNKFLDNVKGLYNEKDCYMCIHKVPEEGCVIRIEGLDFEAYKQKSNAFYELETKLLDKGESNIEDEN